MSKSCVWDYVCVLSSCEQALVSSTAESAINVVNLLLGSSKNFAQQGTWKHSDVSRQSAEGVCCQAPYCRQCGNL